jgi:sterol desaturase/sphingolipid hydroxylase (fatty acid hydroxylase superfamily)
MSAALDRQVAVWVVDVLRLCVWLALLAAIFVPLERLFALRPQKVLRTAIAVDLGYYFINSLFTGVLLSAPLGLVAWAAHRAVPGTIHATVAAWPLSLRALAALVVGEVGFYWGHRWSHEIPFLWRFHAVHHSAGQLDFLVNTRAHPVDMVFGRLCGLVPLYVLGLSGPVGTAGSVIALLIVLFGTLWGFFIHANLRWRLGGLEWLISTPAFHHWHHTMTGAINRNYAPMLPVLDRIFGTYHLPARQWPDEYGITTAMSCSLAGQLLQPLTPTQPGFLAARSDNPPLA